jgi:hypothetical protein
MPQSWRWSISTSKVTKLNALVTEMNLTAQHSFQRFRLVGLWTVCYSVCIAQAGYTCIYIRDYVRQKVRPAILVTESSTQLIMYSLDICVRYCTYLPIFKSQKGSIEALNFLNYLIDYLIHYTIGFIIDYTIDYTIITS